MEKQLSIYSYWLGLLSAVIATVLRALSVLGIMIHKVEPGSTALSYNTFYHGGTLLLLLAIASAGVVWLKKN